MAKFYTYKCQLHLPLGVDASSPSFVLAPTNNVEVDERSTPQLPRITCMQTPITEERSKKLWRLEFPDP